MKLGICIYLLKKKLKIFLHLFGSVGMYLINTPVQFEAKKEVTLDSNNQYSFIYFLFVSFEIN
jgi:hypothetical protein